jgi:hypothetical protein
LRRGHDDVLSDLKDTLEDSRKISEIENVMELVGSGKESVFNFVPDLDGCVSQTINDLVEFVREELGLEGVLNDRTVDAVDVGRENHIEDKELSLESVGNIVTTSTRMIHSTKVLKINDVLELTSEVLFEMVETTLFNELSDDFEGDLIIPLVDEGHRDIVDKDSHLLVTRRGVVFTGLGIAFSFNRSLEVVGKSGG